MSPIVRRIALIWLVSSLFWSAIVVQEMFDYADLMLRTYGEEPAHSTWLRQAFSEFWPAIPWGSAVILVVEVGGALLLISGIRLIRHIRQKASA
ncbi:MAG: hypothetical protein E5W70_14645 [Mesorhizobium sp.]|uniref:hypothetical protein n=1 Tax=Mesorhizobium sp. TaxID=1871066 RepID=UPI0012211446|nr:hypothetical protein [Mesorhizobium sp.]TIT21964.1 MAG: hypothetical protein E5W70_14645 [Mesorhizobium sp.]